MENGLVTITNSIAVCDRKDVAKQIMTVCSAITPQFYRNLSVDDRKAERMSIELLTENIDQEVVAVMCQMAVKQYPLARARNEKSYFDVNYILTFYEKAFEYYWCDSVKIDRTWEIVGHSFNKYTNVLTEKWKKGDEEKTVKHIVKQSLVDATTRCGEYCNYHSPKYYDFLYDIDE